MLFIAVGVLMILVDFIWGPTVILFAGSQESYGKALGNGIAGTMLRDATFSFDELFSLPVFPGCLTGIQAHKQVKVWILVF